jgi:hypothetical protein
MEFRIVVTVRLGGEGTIVAWFVNGPRQSVVPSFSRRVGGIVVSKL